MDQIPILVIMPKGVRKLVYKAGRIEQIDWRKAKKLLRKGLVVLPYPNLIADWPVQPATTH